MSPIRPGEDDASDSSSEGGSVNDIAIVGIAAHLPGARGPREFWKNLRAGLESVQTFSDAALAAAGVRAGELADPAYVKKGVVLEEMEHFDAEFFGFGPQEAAILDPQHRHFLECAWEALEDAGHPPHTFDGSIGVFGGCGMGAYFAFNLLSNPALVDSVGLFLLRHTGNDKDFLCTRVSYCLDLKGPSVNVQTACSTSLVAVHLAAQSLLNGECDLALAGGVTIEIPHYRGYPFKSGEILSPDGHCRAFDHRAQGTIFGSGAALVALRRLEDALADGDHIYALIKGSAINNDGAGKVGYLAPSVDGQAAAVAEAIALAGIEAETIDYVETHGTGTAVGDPIEVAALTQAFRQSTKANGFCALGSLKTNIGHLDTAAGVAGLIKVALALEHGQIPPSLNYEAPNPAIDFPATPFFVASALRSWPRSERPRRAGVNSLGVGGTNAHVIVEEPPAAARSIASKRSQQLIVLSARTRAGLDDSARRLARHLREHPGDELADVAWTLQVGRRTFSERRVVAAASAGEATELLESGDPRRVFSHSAVAGSASAAFVFPGGGAQYPRMGIDLHASEPSFRESVERGLALFHARTGRDLRPMLFTDPDRIDVAAQTFRRPSLQLPALFIIEHALAELWRSLGLEPAALIGHSLGENTAACVAGVLSYEDALGLVSLRGELFERLAGGMLSVELSEAELLPLLGPEIDLAAVNAPKLCVASGSPDALAALARRLAERSVEFRPVPITIAAHSRALAPILDEFRGYLERIRLSPPRIPIVSNRTGAWLTDAQATSPAYWVEHLRHTIRFADGIETLLAPVPTGLPTRPGAPAKPVHVLIECGPGKTLSSLARQQKGFDPARHHAIASLRHADEKLADDTALTTAFGRAWAAGVPLDLTVLSRGERRRRVSLPTYAFQRKRHWIEPGASATATQTQESAFPTKLADRDAWFHRPVWRERACGPAETPATGTTAARPKSWLVFVDDAGVGERVAERLRARGDEVRLVEPGDRFCKLGPRAYALAPEHGREGYDALVQDLVASGALPERIVHLGLVTARESFRPGSSFFHKNQEHGFYSLFFLAQALAGEALRAPLHIAVVSNGMQSVEGEPLPHPEKATVLGPCRVIPREIAQVTCASIDVALPADSRGRRGRNGVRRFNGIRRSNGIRRGAGSEGGNLDVLVDRLCAELDQPPASAVVALRGAKRFVLELERAASAPSPENDAAHGTIRERGVYLITGGLGGIGLTIAEHLARTARARLVLVSRSGIPEPAQRDAAFARLAPDDPEAQRIARVRELETLGAEVEVVAADVTDVEALAAGLARAEQRFGPIAGVIHAAGVIADAPLQAKTQAQVEDVFTPKVHGTLVLEELFASRKLDFFVVFSSTSALFGPAGQIDYVAANAFLDAWAQSRAARLHARSIAWGIWSQVGMAAAAARGGTAGPRPVRARHPLFDTRTDGIEGSAILSARWSASRHWILDEHRTAAGLALIPGTGYIELARAALAEIGERRPFEIRDLVFLRPLAVADGETLECRVRLTPASEGFALAVESRATLADGRGGWRTHAEARLLLHAFEPAGHLDCAEIQARCTRASTQDENGIRARQEQHLHFGPRWRVLRRLALGEHEALADLALQQSFASDVDEYALHPALLDYATSAALELLPGYDGDRDLWVPVSYKSIRIHAALTPEIRSWVRLRSGRGDGELASFDVVLVGRSGAVLVEIEGFSVRRIAGGQLTAPPITAAELTLDVQDRSDTRELGPGAIALRHNLSQGILPKEGVECFERALASGAVRIVASSLDLGALARQAEASAAMQSDTGTKFARPAIASEYVEPRDGIERTLVSLWEELLGVNPIGIRDGFFDLGGHSLIAVRLFARIKKAFHVDWPISMLFEAATIEACADRIRASTAGGAEPADAERPRYDHLVAMHAGRGGEKTPFFLVAGMFGNVLNLRHLAHLLGAERRFYGLQARGLYGDHAPHETFEEMARDYLAEVRTVQPRGPYLIGGFSGGGITAWEMARQLREAGEEVALLALLDTPLPQSPPLSAHEKVRIHLQRVKRQGPSYLTDWVRNRVRWELYKRRRQELEEGAQRPSNFQSGTIEQAFRRALGRYQLRHEATTVTLFRPKLDLAHVLGQGRVTNRHREFVFHDNGWGPYCARVDVHEVPGDHDSMVLEPNVRVMATKLRRAIEQVVETHAPARVG